MDGQLCEAIKIARDGGLGVENLMNAKEKYSRCVIPQIEMTGDAGGSQQQHNTTTTTAPGKRIREGELQQQQGNTCNKRPRREIKTTIDVLANNNTSNSHKNAPNSNSRGDDPKENNIGQEKQQQNEYRNKEQKEKKNGGETTTTKEQKQRTTSETTMKKETTTAKTKTSTTTKSQETEDEIRKPETVNTGAVTTTTETPTETTTTTQEETTTEAKRTKTTTTTTSTTTTIRNEITHKEEWKNLMSHMSRMRHSDRQTNCQNFYGKMSNNVHKQRLTQNFEVKSNPTRKVYKIANDSSIRDYFPVLTIRNIEDGAELTRKSRPTINSKLDSSSDKLNIQPGPTV